MRLLRFSLFTKIMLWFFLNLLLLSIFLFCFFNPRFRTERGLPFFSESTNRIEAVTRLITGEVQDSSREERDEILKRYTEAYQVDFFVFDNAGKQLAGKETKLPDEVINEVTKFLPQPPPMPVPIKRPSAIGNPPPPPPPMNREQNPRPSIFNVKTSNPTRYWLGIRIPVFEKGKNEPIRSTLLVSSDSISGHGLFFDPTPWIVTVTVIFVVSILFWLPFVRSITKSIRQMTIAAEQIAEEQFDVRVNENRTDELGRLGKTVNHLASRLSGFVNGQKRFLGDVSHELNSPLARMQFALSILENRVDAANRGYVEDVREDVQLMSKLVSELLAYSKAGMKSSDVKLESVCLFPLAQQVIEREAKKKADVRLEVDNDLEVLAHPELLSRAFANVIRNAIRYAGAAGPITVSAERDGEHVQLAIADCGLGVPESEIEKLFDPFYRLETDRARTTGGAGLGLAIVKTCVESCRGTVTAKNRNPSGLEVIILLKAVS
jgi:two-component system sensor histidine kinase CpxA